MKIHCPICKADVERPDGFEHRPFCSSRCKLVDLGNWLGDKYRISRPMRQDEAEDDELPLN